MMLVFQIVLAIALAPVVVWLLFTSDGWSAMKAFCLMLWMLILNSVIYLSVPALILIGCFWGKF